MVNPAGARRTWLGSQLRWGYPRSTVYLQSIRADTTEQPVSEVPELLRLDILTGHSGDDYRSARSGFIPSLPWPTFVPPFSPLDHADDVGN